MSDEMPEDRRNGFFLVLPNARSSGNVARQRFTAYLLALALETECADDILMAVGEALANAVEHGHRPNGTLTLTAYRSHDTGDDDRLHIEVIDDGHGFAPRPHAVPDSSSPRGFGIFIMRKLMDTVEFHDGGRRVVLAKSLRRR